MQKNYLSSKQAICTMILFVLGTSALISVNIDAEQDTWIAMIVSCAMSIPVILVYARVLSLFPEKNFYDIVEILIGKAGSKLIVLLITWYAIHLGAFVMSNFHLFISIVDLPNTPHFMILVPLLILAIYLAKSGLSTFGNWSIINLIIVSIVVIITAIACLKTADFSQLLPVFDHSISEICMSSYKIFTFPLAETVVFMSILGSVKSGTSPYRIYISGILLGTIILLLTILRNNISLGTQMLSSACFPSYTSTRVMSIGSFLTRIEGSISINFLLAGITKFTVCIFAASNGLAKLFGIKNPKMLIIPTCLLMLSVCCTSYTGIIEMFAFLNDSYYIYAIPFQLIIPLGIWIVAEIRTHRGKIQLKE